MIRIRVLPSQNGNVFIHASEKIISPIRSFLEEENFIIKEFLQRATAHSAGNTFESMEHTMKYNGYIETIPPENFNQKDVAQTLLAKFGKSMDQLGDEFIITDQETTFEVF
jgi:hypothetical protein